MQADRSAQLDDRGGRTAHRLDPRRQLGRVADRGRQAHQPDVLGEVDDDLLPHRTAVGVLEEVDLVEHDQAEVVERGRPGVDHVAQHLGGHHHDRRLAVDGVVAGQQADATVAVALAQVAELLVRQRLQRGRVEGPPAGPPRRLDAVLGDDRLAAAGRRGHDDVMPGVEGIDAPRAGSGRAGRGSRRRWRPGRVPPRRASLLRRRGLGRRRRRWKMVPRPMDDEVEHEHRAGPGRRARSGRRTA